MIWFLLVYKEHSFLGNLPLLETSLFSIFHTWKGSLGFGI